ncbi:hypothetical protein CsatB_029536 [Cannabis sativa]
MKIIQSFMTVVNPASFLKNHFKLDASYSNEEINAVRDEWAEFVKPLIIDSVLKIKERKRLSTSGSMA